VREVAVLLLFAAAREAAGTGREEVDGATVGEVLAAARARHGDTFTRVLAASKVWRNGEPAGDDEPVGPTDEVAVLPPVSGGGDACAPPCPGAGPGVR
jgi:molybdopterin converting factor small subunit